MPAEDLTYIGDGAFYGCSALEEILFPSSVTYIGDSVLAYCSSLETITVSEGNSIYHSAGNCLIETNTGALLAGCKNSIIPEDGSVVDINDYAFAGCTGLESITIPNGVMNVGNSAF